MNYKLTLLTEKLYHISKNNENIEIPKLKQMNEWMNYKLPSLKQLNTERSLNSNKWMNEWIIHSFLVV